MDEKSNMQVPVKEIAMDVGIKTIVNVINPSAGTIIPVDLARFGIASGFYTMMGPRIIKAIPMLESFDQPIGKLVEKVGFVTLFNFGLSMVFGSRIDFFAEFMDNTAGFGTQTLVNKYLTNRSTA